MRRLVSCCVVLAAVLLVTPAFATTIRVPSDQPTIQAGVDAAAPGDTVLLAAGTYVEQIVMASDIVLSGSGAANTLVEGHGPSGGAVRCMGTYGPLTEIRDLTIRNTDSNSWSCGIWCEFDCQITLRRVCFADCWMGVLVKTNGPRVFAENMTVVGSRWHGVFIYNGQSIPATGEVHIVNSIIVGSAECGIRRASGSSGNQPMPDEPVLACNDVWGNATDYSQCTPGSTDFSSDPMFCGAEFGDYRIDDMSPCAPQHSPCGELVGALMVGCGASTVENLSWSAIKVLYR